MARPYRRFWRNWLEKRGRSPRKTPRPPKNPLLKRCPRCLEVYPKTEEYFYIYKSTNDGWSPYCKTCAKAWRRAEYARNRGKNKYKPEPEAIRDDLNKLMKDLKRLIAIYGEEPHDAHDKDSDSRE